MLELNRPRPFRDSRFNQRPNLWPKRLSAFFEKARDLAGFNLAATPRFREVCRCAPVAFLWHQR